MLNFLGIRNAGREGLTCEAHSRVLSASPWLEGRTTNRDFENRFYFKRVH